MQTEHQQNMMKCALITLCAVLIGSVSQAFRKLGIETCTLTQGVTSIYLGQALGVSLLFAQKKLNPIRVTNKKIMIAGGIISVFCAFMNLYCLREFKLFEFQSVFCSTDLVIIIVGSLIVGERLGLSKILGSLLCFLGALMCVNAGMPQFSLASVLVFVLMFAIAFRFILGKISLKTDPKEMFLFYTIMIPTVIVNFYAIFISGEWQFSGLFFAVGLSVCLIRYLELWAISYGTLGIYGAVSFTEVILAGFLGFLFFDTSPTLLSVLGTVAILTGMTQVMIADSRIKKSVEQAPQEVS